MNYGNNLMNMNLVIRNNHDYFFVTKSNQVYKPNWFHDTLHKVTEFDTDQVCNVIHGHANQSTFRSKGGGMAL